MSEIIVIGGGLAGCEAAWQIAQYGVKTTIYEMRPNKTTPAHTTSNLAELVCSNSFKSQNTSTALGLLKQEMSKLNSLLLYCAKKTAVPGGDALCVDRERFSSLVTEKISNHPNITVIREEIKDIPSNRPVIIATGPLTSDAFAESISNLAGNDNLYFFDAIAPSIEADSINYDIVFRKSRYDKGEAAYLNCPMNQEEYYRFIDALLSAEKTKLHLEEEKNPLYFEGCLPIEVMAERGKETLCHGTMKPVGLTNPKTGERPYAVVQLRQENEEGSIFGLVGFQTQLKIKEQEKVFRMIPGLENAVFIKYGQVHRNTYINSPLILKASLNTKDDNMLFFAGQITGVEGYLASASTGIVAGINSLRVLNGQEPLIFPKETVIGSLLNYISTPSDKDFQPMNANLGLLPPLEI
ncbi:MAG: methylenetetrahydrofolate--tRNA-(uracil(54)-C(5))-methyltransferase (FADH(2)-oxidizing) TrmFO, partial [Armatimonadota bacterium]